MYSKMQCGQSAYNANFLEKVTVATWQQQFAEIISFVLIVALFRATKRLLVDCDILLWKMSHNETEEKK